MSNSRIPDSIPAFNSYINSTDTYLQAIDPVTLINNGTRLTLTGAESGQWNLKRVFWRDTLYPKYADENQRTKTVVKDVSLFMKDFRTFANPLLDKMASCGFATTADESALKFVVFKDTTPTPKGKINDVPYVQITPLGLGEVKMRVRTSEDATRASRHPLSDGIEYKYLIVPESAGTSKPSAPPSSGTPGSPSTPAATSMVMPEDCTNTVISKKALSTIALGSTASGKRLLLYARWVNLSKPANNGPWTQLMQTIVL
ncbi:MAG: hypothetical protein POELPBGB_03918 [Bacteroidia bacterium]|nr:hypothetical protein [Bacteroidia bacterium]